MEALADLSKITLILFIGLIVGLIAKKLKLPSMVLLILTGVILNNITVNGQNVVGFNADFLITTSVLALVLIVFKESSRFTLKDLTNYTESALKMAIMFLALNMVFLSIAVFSLFYVRNVILSLVFASVMSGTDPASVLSLFQTKSNKITEILKFESVINTPIVVLIPFILLDLMELGIGGWSSFFEYIYPFLQQIVTGIGAGVVIGIIVFRFMRKFYSEKLSPLTLLTSALLTYVMSERLGGNGVLAVTVLGVFFGNTSVKKKEELQAFSTMLSNSLEIFVFLLIGFILPLKVSFSFVIKSLLLFVIMIFIRFVSIQLVYIHDHTNLKERIFMSLNAAKGIAVAVVAFTLSTYILEVHNTSSGSIDRIPLQTIAGTTELINLMIFFIIYSIILSSIAARYSQKFIRLKVEET